MYLFGGTDRLFFPGGFGGAEPFVNAGGGVGGEHVCAYTGFKFTGLKFAPVCIGACVYL